MKPRFVLMVGLGLQSAVACLVPTFDVDSMTSENGGASATGGTKTTGGAKTTGGTSVAGATNPRGGGSANGGTTGTTPGSGGDSGGAGGATTGEGGASAGTGPRRVGFSVFHDSASGGDQASSKLANATFTKPAGTAPGDFMLVFFGCDHHLNNLTGTQLDDAGWTLQDQHEELGTDGQGTYLLYRFVDGSEPDSIVFEGINDPGSGNGVQGLLLVYRGVNPTSPINDYATNPEKTGSSSGTSIVTATPAITTTVDDCLLIAGLSPDTAIDAPVVSSWPEGFDENRVSVINPPAPYPLGWANIYSAERHVAEAGTIPASAFQWDITYGGTEYYGSLSFVLALAP